MNTTLKHGLERALSSVPVEYVTRHRLRGKCLILAYHGIRPEGWAPAGERSLFVRQRDFAAQLDTIGELADVVPLNHLYDLPRRRPRVAITFDDAYRGAVNEGVQELVKRKFPATIFVAPGRLGDHTFWWDALSEGAPMLDEAVRVHALHRLAGSDERVRAWAAKIRLPSSDNLPRYAQTATSGELRTAVANDGITVASHTWSHANLAALAPDEITSELERSRDWLRDEFAGKAIPWVAYPYGLDCEDAHLIAARAGYVGGVRIGGGWHHHFDAPPFARPRLNVPASLSAAGFRARLLGALRP